MTLPLTADLRLAYHVGVRIWPRALLVVLAGSTFLAEAACSRGPSPATREGLPPGANTSLGLPDARTSPELLSTSNPPVLPAADARAADLCADIRARFNAVYATRSDKCVSATGCACFNPVGGPELGCGGVTDIATAKKLGEIAKEFHAASCPWTHQCAAWACAPRCEAGHCTR